VKMPGFTAVMSLREASSRSRSGSGSGSRFPFVARFDPPANPDEHNAGGVVPASYWGWWDGLCGWDCFPAPAGERTVRAVLYDIPWGWDWMRACTGAVGVENRHPNSCQINLFGPPPGYVVEGQWWVTWANSEGSPFD
jgi:hypothetical protein